ncbi:MAG: hypothetical protein LBB61_06345 [Treponema sp.]|jgi:hypothetical protein|nr:hypothetical protein [Treponema sp.]
MEKQRMDRRRFRSRTRLLGLFLLYSFLLDFALFAQEEPAGAPAADPPKDAETVEAMDDQTDADWLEITFSSPTLIRNIPWTITFLVDYPNPSGVFVNPPEFPKELILEEVRVEPRLVTNADGERRSAIQFTFIPQSAAQLLIDPFEVGTPQRSTVTERIPITITGSGVRTGSRRPYFTWEREKDELKIGERGELFLKLLDWDTGKKRPQNVFLFDIPELAILEEHPLTPAEAARNIVLHLTLIPLEGSEITINRYRFQHEGYTLDIPPLRLKVHPKEDGSGGTHTTRYDAPHTDGENAAPASTENDAAFITFVPKFFSDTRTLSPVLTKRVKLFETDALVHDVRSLWQKRQTAEALALIRTIERDHTFGPVFVSGRQELEQYVALEPIHNETWIPKKLCLILFVCILASLLFFIVIGVISKKWKRIPIIVMSFLLPALFFAFTGILQPPKAVLRTADAFYVPEPNGEIQNHFNEGQCVFVRSVSGDWAFVETLDNRTGWVRIEDAVFY